MASDAPCGTFGTINCHTTDVYFGRTVDPAFRNASPRQGRDVNRKFSFRRGTEGTHRTSETSLSAERLPARRIISPSKDFHLKRSLRQANGSVVDASNFQTVFPILPQLPALYHAWNFKVLDNF